MNNVIPAIAGTNEKIEQMKKEIAATRERGATPALVSLMKNLGQVYLEEGDAPQALSEFNEAIKLVYESEYKEILAQLLGLRGMALKMLGKRIQ